MSARRTRIAIVEDHKLLAESLMMALSAQQFEPFDVPLPDSPAGPNQLLELILGAEPTIVLLDLDLGRHQDGRQLIEPLVLAGCAVLVMTGAESPVVWGECLAKGAAAVLPKTTHLHEMVHHVHQAARGAAVMPPATRDELVRRWRQRRTMEATLRGRLERLTPREAEVLRALVIGKRVREIAVEGYVSEDTVRSQVRAILGKLQVNSQIAALALARQAGWTGRDDHEPGYRPVGR